MLNEKKPSPPAEDCRFDSIQLAPLGRIMFEHFVIHASLCIHAKGAWMQSHHISTKHSRIVWYQLHQVVPEPFSLIRLHCCLKLEIRQQCFVHSIASCYHGRCLCTFACHLSNLKKVWILEDGFQTTALRVVTSNERQACLNHIDDIL